MRNKVSGLLMLYREYQRANIRGLQFELVFLQYVLAIRVQRLAAKLVLSKCDELMEMIRGRCENGSTKGQ